MSDQDKKIAIEYLFGELGEVDQDVFEERIFSDDEFSLSIEAWENDLVDEYLRNEMAPELRQRFERGYLVSERRHEKVRLASLLQNEVFTKNAGPELGAVEKNASLLESLLGLFRVPNLIWLGGATVVLLGILGIGLMLFRQGEKTVDYARDDASNQQPQQSPSPGPPIDSPVANTQTNKNSGPITNTNAADNRKTEKTPTTPSIEKPDNLVPQRDQKVFVATLLPALRSDLQPSLQIPKPTKTVALKIIHDNQKPFTKYRVDLRNQDDSVVFSRAFEVTEKTLRNPIDLSLPNSILKTGSYELTLIGIAGTDSGQPIKFYNFTVKQN